MTAAATPDSDAMRGMLEELDETYSGAWAVGLFPLRAGTKRPLAEGWLADAMARYETWRTGSEPVRATLRGEHLAAMAGHVAGGGNLGLALPRGVAVIDAEDLATIRACDALDGAWQWSRESEQRAHAVVRCDPDLRQRDLRIDGAPAPVKTRIGGRGYIVAAPSVHPETGEPYTWARALPETIGALPELPAAWAEQLRGGGEREERADTGDTEDGEGAIPDGQRNATLTSLAGTMRRRGMTAEEIEAALLAVNARRCRPRLPEAEVREIARSVSRYRPATGTAERAEDASASETEDLANAQRLAQHHGRELRWSPGRGWLAYTGTVWEESETRALAIASRLGRIIQREAAERAEQAAKAESEVDRERLAKQAEALLRWARASEQAKRIRAALDLARPMLEIGEEALDADPYALACHNGVVDLRTGTLRPHRPEDYVTRCTGVAYDPEAHSELWDRVLAEALPEEPVRDYLRRCAGYTALGLTGEDVLLLVHGPTRTSKGTIQGAIAAALGSYAMTAGLETFAARRHADGARARPELIRLRGARMVSVYETGRALRLDAPLVKSLAGSDAITARALYREEVEFRPACTLWLATNHRPLVDNDDDSLWERMREIPFRVQVTPERRDPAVRARLADPTDCGPAVLAWIVRGALDYQREGLAQPEAVRSATGDYRASMDPLGEYLGECAVLAARAWVAAGALREDYERWCRERGAKPLAASRWGDALRRHGAEREKVGETRGWRGIGLRSTARDRET